MSDAESTALKSGLRYHAISEVMPIFVPESQRPGVMKERKLYIGLFAQ